MFFREKTRMPAPDEALPGRSTALQPPAQHYVNRAAMSPPWPANSQLAMFGLGCFWGAERRFWETPGVLVTMVGYAGGYTPNPSYEEVCTGRTGHNEVVRLVFDPAQISYEQLVTIFFQAHDPTQGMRQGNDVGTQYRSGVYCYSDEQRATAQAVSQRYQAALRDAGLAAITTEILPAPEFYYAEPYHQQYLAKNPGGYCGLGGTGVSCPA
jgi:peptide-methionine (S)-S-oxide reductase